MSALLFRHYGMNQKIAPHVTKRIIPKELYEEQWMGVYYRDEKIGYSSRKLEKLENDRLLEQEVREIGKRI
jgi:hypothetical protein